MPRNGRPGDPHLLPINLWTLKGSAAVALVRLSVALCVLVSLFLFVTKYLICFVIIVNKKILLLVYFIVNVLKYNETFLCYWRCFMCSLRYLGDNLGTPEETIWC